MVFEIAVLVTDRIIFKQYAAKKHKKFVTNFKVCDSKRYRPAYNVTVHSAEMGKKRPP